MSKYIHSPTLECPMLMRFMISSRNRRISSTSIHMAPPYRFIILPRYSIYGSFVLIDNREIDRATLA